MSHPLPKPLVASRWIKMHLVIQPNTLFHILEQFKDVHIVSLNTVYQQKPCYQDFQNDYLAYYNQLKSDSKDIRPINVYALSLSEDALYSIPIKNGHIFKPKEPVVFVKPYGFSSLSDQKIAFSTSPETYVGIELSYPTLYEKNQLGKKSVENALNVHVTSQANLVKQLWRLLRKCTTTLSLKSWVHRDNPSAVLRCDNKLGDPKQVLDRFLG